MKRRTLLVTTGAALASLAGCATVAREQSDPETTPEGDSQTDSPADAPTDSPADAPTDSSPEYPTSGNDLERYDPDRQYESVELGSRAGVRDPDDNLPHGIGVWNATGASRSVDVHVVDRDAGRTLLDDRFAIPADAALSLSLLEPSTYLVTVAQPDSDVRETLRVSTGYFDCNSSTTQIGVFEDGIRSRVITTLIACTDATVSAPSTSTPAGR